MKILYLLQDKSPFSGQSNIIGGHIAHIIGVVEAFQQLGHEVLIGTFDRVPYWDNEKIRYWLFDEVRVPIPGLGVLIGWWRLTNQILKIIVKERPDLLYVRWAANLYFGRVRLMFPNLTIVAECNTPLEMGLYIWGGKPAVVWKHLAYKMDKIYLNSATIISAVSEEVKEFLMERHPSLDSHRVIVNPNGVDTSRFRYIDSNDVRNNYGIPMEAIVIGYAGNFCPWHRLDLLIRAFQDMEIEGVYLLIIGTGPIELEKNLKSLALRSRPNRIIFTGAVPFSMMPKYLSACDILVSPQSGTFKGKLHQSPIKLYEYMATGRAVIGSRISQISKVIEDGRNGLLFEPDSLQDLKRVLEQAVKDRGLRERIGKQARYDAEQKYSWKANVLRILDAISYQNR